jgi:nitrilase
MASTAHLAPTWDDADCWVATMRHIAKEGRCFVIGVNSCIRGSDVPAELLGRADLYGGQDDWMSRGLSVIVDPNGDVLGGPVSEREEILFAELGLDLIRRARQQFDPAGHYTRPDVFTLTVDAAPQDGVKFLHP